jgi:16S rRNA (uracil1498-N3)-methyltransferase
MRRFFLPQPECRSDHLILTGSEAHHAADVLRLKAGDEVAVLDGAGGELACRVETVTRKQVKLEVKDRKTEAPPPWQINLVQAIPKGKIFEAIIQKATELGVWRIVPLLSQRVTTHLEGESIEHKAEKWRQTAVEAIKQCGQRWLPKVEPPIPLPALLARADNCDLALLGSLQDGARHPREYFMSYEREHRRRPASVVAWIGPEGDFSHGEVEAIEKSGAHPMTLGPLILRSETAALYTLSIINYELNSPNV